MTVNLSVIRNHGRLRDTTLNKQSPYFRKKPIKQKVNSETLR